MNLKIKSGVTLLKGSKLKSSVTKTIYVCNRERPIVLFSLISTKDCVKKTTFILLSHNLKNPFQRQPEKRTYTPYKPNPNKRTPSLKLRNESPIY